MPSKSKKQKRFMAAAAHNPKFAKKVGIKQKVAKEFNRADTRKKFANGGLASVAKNYFQRQPDPGGIMRPNPGAMVNPMYRRPPNPGGPMKQFPGQQRLTPPVRQMGGLGQAAQVGGGPIKQMPGNPMTPPPSRGMPPQQGNGALAQMMQRLIAQKQGGGAPQQPADGFPSPGGVPGGIPGNSPYTGAGGPSGPLRRPQLPGAAGSSIAGRYPVGGPPNGLLRTAGAASGRFGNQLNSLMGRMGNQQRFAAGGGVKALLKKQRLLIDGKIINPGDVVVSPSDGDRYIFKSISRYNEQAIGGNSAGKIIVSPEDNLDELVEEFVAGYNTNDPKMDELAEILNDQMGKSNFDLLQEAIEGSEMWSIDEVIDRSRGTMEYYPSVVEGELAQPPIKRIKARGGRIKMAGGGKIKRAVAKLQAARNELNEASDPDIDLIGRDLMSDPETHSVGRRILANEKKLDKGSYSDEDIRQFYLRIHRLLDEAEAKADSD